MGAKFLLGSLVFYLDTLKNVFSKTNNPIYTNFGLEVPWVLTRKNCFQRSHPLSKMAARDSICWDSFDLFSRTIAWTVTKLSTIGHLVVLKKCYYFLLRLDFHDGHLELWLAETYSTCSSRTTAGTITKLSINIPFIALQKFHYFLLR